MPEQGKKVLLVVVDILSVFVGKSFCSQRAHNMAANYNKFPSEARQHALMAFCS